jgi:hypothetical protein
LDLGRWCRTALRANRANHPVGWVAAAKTQNRQCSCGCFHPSPFFVGSNFVLIQRYVLIEIRALNNTCSPRRHRDTEKQNNFSFFVFSESVCLRGEKE